MEPMITVQGESSRRELWGVRVGESWPTVRGANVTVSQTFTEHRHPVDEKAVVTAGCPDV